MPETTVAATVADHDPATGSGSVLLDDGKAWSYGADAFAAGGLRLLRSGQRVEVVLVDGIPARIGIAGVLPE